MHLRKTPTEGDAGTPPKLNSAEPCTSHGQTPISHGTFLHRQPRAIIPHRSNNRHTRRLSQMLNRSLKDYLVSHVLPRVQMPAQYLGAS